VAPWRRNYAGHGVWGVGVGDRASSSLFWHQHTKHTLAGLGAPRQRSRNRTEQKSMALCAAAMLPFGSGNPRALVAADTQCDGPAINAVWLIGTHHKTGTELNNEIMRRLPEGCKRDACGIVEKCMTTEPECVTAAVTAAGGGGIAFAEHLSIASVSKYADIIAAATEGAGSPLLRVAHWVRDPTEIIMSGFFYHKVTHELWVHANGTLAQKWFDACEAGDDGAAQTACSAAINLEGSVRSGSYQELLNALPDEEGVLVEAWRAGEELAEMNATMHVLGSFPKQSITVDLGEAEAKCERVFGLVFEARRTAPRTQPAVGELVPTLSGCLDLESNPPRPHAPAARRYWEAHLWAASRGACSWAAPRSPLGKQITGWTRPRRVIASSSQSGWRHRSGLSGRCSPSGRACSMLREGTTPRYL
jgi:hypothetical protein